MKRMLQLILCITVISSALLGCSSSPVTDVGNPTVNKPPAADGGGGGSGDGGNQAPSPAAPSVARIPQIADLVGSYQILTPTSGASVCTVTPNTAPQVAHGSGADQIVLKYLVAFSAASESVTVTYNGKTGAFEWTDVASAMACTGSAKFVGVEVQIELKCQTAGTSFNACAALFQKLH